MMNEDESSGGGQGHTLRHTQGGMMAVPRPATAEELALDRIEADGRSNGYMVRCACRKKQNLVGYRTFIPTPFFGYCTIIV